MLRLLTLAALLTRASAMARTVTWAVKVAASQPAPPTFGAWFADAANPVESAIVGASESISEVIDKGGGKFEGRVAGAKFPLVTLEPVMAFSLDRRGPDAVAITLDEQRMEATGPKWATRIVVAMASIMDTSSTSVFSVADGAVTCEAAVEATFDVPRWVPVPLKSIQEGGQKAIQKQVEGDVAKMVENLLKSDPGEIEAGGSGI
mmetsp:Transcript_2026/g.6036  ORF Transcript_2026/g.6036 Transcript_2026/m.6036 type:complete len:205 (+) Transcript_2026:204-818(+)